MRLTAISILAALLAACGDPLVMIPGGKLAGEEADAPAQWVDVPDTIQLETRTGNPYSINIWSVGIGSDLYVATGEDGTTWSNYVEADPAVRVRIDGSIYRLTARPVIHPSERAAVAAAYTEKYELDVDDNWLKSGIIFRLDR